MTPLQELLHDIEGLDPISWWPLATGWWILIAMGILIICVLGWLAARKMSFRRSWKNDTLKKLSRLEENLSDATAREAAIALSEYLRRIALRRFSRVECAGLTGDAWLKWLATHDKHHFDWEKKGALLIKVPYAPENSPLSADAVKDLIQATRKWVC